MSIEEEEQQLLDDMFDDLMEGIGDEMNDFSDIKGDKPNKVEYLYAIPENFRPLVEHGRIYIENYPYITIWKIIREGEDFESELEQTDRYVKGAETNHHNGMFKQYLKIEKLEGIIEIDNRIDIYEDVMTLDNVFDKGHKDLYLMKDGTLKPTYFVGELYYSLEDAKEVVVKKMRKVVDEMDTMVKKIQEEAERETKSWNKAFHQYPHLAI